jgi:hypothetical protein
VWEDFGSQAVTKHGFVRWEVQGLTVRGKGPFPPKKICKESYFQNKYLEYLQKE